MVEIFAINGATIAFLLLILWIASVLIKDASIIDIFWGPGFGLIALITFFCTTTPGPLGLLLTGLTLLWAIRLGSYLGARWISHGRTEDSRYVSMRHRAGSGFAIQSLFTVFALQGVLMWSISLPVQVAIYHGGDTSFGFLTWIGCLLFAAGFILEALADNQLREFKAIPENTGKILQSGVWSWSRHPNYFGNACLWWGLFLIALPAPYVIWTIFSPALMTYLLLNVSGVALLERRLARSKSDYLEYQRTVNTFVPLPPKRNRHKQIDRD